MNPSKSRFYKSNRVLNSFLSRRLDFNDMAGIRINKKFTSLLVEGGGYEKLGFSEQDCRNHLPKFRWLKLEEGDATAMHNYFGKMQAYNS